MKTCQTDQEAYPGTPLRRGSTGDPVRYVQFMLNGFQKLVYPEMKKLKVDGIYGAESEANILQYQLHKGLSADGIVGRNTWNMLVADYEALPAGKYTPYPGVIQTWGSTGYPVEVLQNELNALDATYTALGTQTADGKFGEHAAQAVRLFQKQFGLNPDEKVGEKTWNRIVEVGRSVQAGKPVEVTPRYPGLLRVGSSGDEVRLVQAYLNRISEVNGQFHPQIEVDGIYGKKVEEFVTAFQYHYGLSADGIVGRQTWAKLVEQVNDAT